METETNKFSFTGKTVTVIGGKGKMGSSFARGLSQAGANITLVDRDTEPLGEKPETDVLLFAVNELTTVNLLREINKEILHSVPIITTSSTNGLLHIWTLTDRIAKGAHFHGHKQLKHLVPIHVLSGPKMEGAVMIDCTESGTLSRKIAQEVAKVFVMGREEISFAEHDRKIALEQARFHGRIWRWLQSIDDLEMWARRLPISQRRAAIGELRVLMRPDISAELISSFCELFTLGQKDKIPPIPTDFNLLPPAWAMEADGNQKSLSFNFPDHKSAIRQQNNENIIHTELIRIISEKDPDGFIRDWIRTENGGIDEGIPGGPKSFQQFLRENRTEKTNISTAREETFDAAADMGFSTPREW